MTYSSWTLLMCLSLIAKIDCAKPVQSVYWFMYWFPCVEPKLSITYKFKIRLEMEQNCCKMHELLFIKCKLYVIKLVIS